MNEHDDQPLSGEPFTEWKRDVDRAMLADYGINIIDAGIDDDRLRQHWMEEQSPKILWNGSQSSTALHLSQTGAGTHPSLFFEDAFTMKFEIVGIGLQGPIARNYEFPVRVQ